MSCIFELVTGDLVSSKHLRAGGSLAHWLVSECGVLRCEMHAIGLICRRLIGLCLVIAWVAVTHGQDAGAYILPDGWQVNTHDANLAFFPWGAPQYTDGDENTYPRPNWVLGAGMHGGVWITNDTWYGWQPSVEDWQPSMSNHRLLIHLDRSHGLNKLCIAVAAAGEENATIWAGFYNDAMVSVAAPIQLHVNTLPWFTNSVDLGRSPTTSIISLFTTNGLVRVFGTVLQKSGMQGNNGAMNGVVSRPGNANGSTTAPDGPGDGDVSCVSTSSPPHDSHAPTAPPSNGTNTTSSSRGAAPRKTAASIWYVNHAAGDDGNDGHSSVTPKRSISGAVIRASHGDTISVAAGVYTEKIDFGKTHMVTTGHVVLP